MLFGPSCVKLEVMFVICVLLILRMSILLAAVTCLFSLTCRFCGDCVLDFSGSCPICATLTKLYKPTHKEVHAKNPIPQSIPSTKITLLINDLISTRQECLSQNLIPVKSIVFTQFTTLLDLIAPRLKEAGIHFARLDGSMSRQERNGNLDSFKRRGCDVLLTSIRAGGVGLNLTHSSRVYLMEPGWNPAIEQQAIDRVHRLGQTLPVVVIKFIVSDSIEEGMCDVLDKKRGLVGITFREEGGKWGGKGREGVHKLVFGRGGYRRLREIVEIDD